MHRVLHLTRNVTLSGTRVISAPDCAGICLSFHRHTSQDTHVRLLTHYDAVIIGAGHNGLVAAAYLQKAGLKVCVLERRHVIGGAACTEEIIPDFKFSRASYVLSLLRPQVMKELDLKKYGLKLHFREYSSYTPLLTPGGLDGKTRSMLLGTDKQQSLDQISRFSVKDAQRYAEYNKLLERLCSALDPMFDEPPIYLPGLIKPAKLSERLKHTFTPAMWALIKAAKVGEKDALEMSEFLISPASKILSRWFESEVFKAYLSTDSFIGEMRSPNSPSTGYLLLHHVMGLMEGRRGEWAFVQGGMGALSQSMAECATDRGASIFTNKVVSEIIVNPSTQHTEGVVLDDGTEIRANLVLSNATSKVTFLDLLPKGTLPASIEHDLSLIDYESPVTKINVAVSRLPNFTADPNTADNVPMAHHQCTVHMNCDSMDMLHKGYVEALCGRTSSSPLIEMTIPSSLDPTLSPPGAHVMSMFTQYTPYHLADGAEWDEETTNAYADKVFDCVEEYAPGFKSSVIGRDVLTPPKLEEIFGLTGGHIFHGSLSLDQFYFKRPIPALSNYSCPIAGLYLCGSGAHPGGGVTGAPGRLAALTALKDKKRRK